ncbi:extracellular solute-binding protein (plasmid) [Shinella yambaruensis]|uniref:ABC transporter substrate-binding protein n=1 Tax=Shinella yambaruensis TaxID=415996 RepID=UPI003D7ABF00
MFLSNETTRKACLGLLTATALGWATTGALAQEALVTPELIGRADAPITLTIQPRFAYSHQSNDKNRRAVLTEAFEAWIRRHPDVKIEVQVQQGDDAVIVAKRLQDAAAGRAADAIMVEDLDYGKFYDLTASIDPFLTETEKSDFLPGVLEGMKHPTTGEVKYLQITSYTTGLWYRRDLMKTPPKTLGELAEMAQKLKDEHGFRYGMFLLGGPGVMNYILMPQMAGIGASIMNQDEQATPVFDEPSNREAMIRVLSWHKDMVDRGLMPSDVVSFASTGDVVSRVEAGEMPFAFGGTFMGGGIRGTSQGDKWAFAPMPTLDGGAPVPFQGGWSWGLFTKDKQKQALLTDLLMETYTGPWAMARWGEAGGYTPTRISALKNYQAFAVEGLDKSFADALATAQPFPKGKLRDVVDNAVNNAYQQVILGAGTPEEAVDEAWATVDAER